MASSEGLAQGTLTVLFTDIEGSTDLTTRRGDAVAREILRAHDEIISREVARSGGREVRSLGDGFMVVFSSARRGIECAVGIQRSLEEHNRLNPHQAVRVRIGLNSGEVTTLDNRDDLYGAAVNAAARIAAKANGGEIFVADVVKQLAGTSTEIPMRDRGRFQLKGFPGRTRVYEVIWREEPTIPVGIAAKTKFIGRGEERSALSRDLDHLIAGAGITILIGGEPGVGKTRLAAEVAADARRRGVRVLSGNCYEMEGAPPYIPFVEILEAALAGAETPEAFRQALGDDAAEIARILPRLRRLFPDIPPALDLPPEQERRYLLNSTRDFIKRGAQLRPALLMIDDLHWADDSSLALLEALAQDLPAIPVMVVATYRDNELGASEALGQMIGRLKSAGLLREVSLKPLSESDVGALVHSLARQQPPAALVEAIYRETEGNPFFVEEIFEHLASQGELFDSRGRFRDDILMDDLDIPEGIRLAVWRRLERVSRTCRKILTEAAILGRGFSYRLLEALAEVDSDTLLNAVEDAEQARLITSVVVRNEARFTFSHELIRSTLVGELSLPRRQRLHLRAAGALKKVHGDDVDEQAAELAHHYFQAGAAADAADVVHWLTVAGERALASAAFEDALKLFERAASFPDDDPERQAAVHHRLGLAQRSLGRWDAALRSWEQALELYERAADTDAVGRLCVTAAFQLGWAARWPESVQMAARGLASLGERVSEDRCRLLAIAGASLSLGRNLEYGGEMLTQARAMAEQIGSVGLLGYTLYGRAMNSFSMMDMPATIDAGIPGARQLLDAGEAWDYANAMSIVQFALLYVGDFERFDAVTAELAPLVTRLGNFGALLFDSRRRAQADFLRTGDVARWQKFAAEDLDLTKAIGSLFLADSHTFIGLGHFWAGDWEAALESLRTGAAEEAPSSVAGNGAFVPLVLAYLGRKAEALAAIDRDRSWWPQDSAPATRTDWTRILCAVEVLYVLGEHEQAASLYPPVNRAIAMGCVGRFYDFRLLETLAGLAATSSGEYAVALRHFDNALERAASFRAVTEAADAMRFKAHALQHLGDLDGAARLRIDAAATYARLGMRGHLELAEAQPVRT